MKSKWKVRVKGPFRIEEQIVEASDPITAQKIVSSMYGGAQTWAPSRVSNNSSSSTTSPNPFQEMKDRELRERNTRATEELVKLEKERQRREENDRKWEAHKQREEAKIVAQGGSRDNEYFFGNGHTHIPNKKNVSKTQGFISSLFGSGRGAGPEKEEPEDDQLKRKIISNLNSENAYPKDASLRIRVTPSGKVYMFGDCDSLRQAITIVNNIKSSPDIKEVNGCINYRVDNVSKEELEYCIYKDKAEAGDVDSMAYLAECYYFGSGTNKNDIEALHLCKTAADAGNSVALFRLGFFYELGECGIVKDESEAAKLYQLSADYGYVIAQFYLGMHYQNGTCGFETDKSKARHYYKMAADQGDIDAKFYWANLNIDEEGVSKEDEEKAYKLLKETAENGYVDAQLALGYAYEEGKWGCEQNDTAALKFYELAAAQNHSGARYKVGIFHKEGRGGLQQNNIIAESFFTLSAEDGNEYAKKALDEMNSPKIISDIKTFSDKSEEINQKNLYIRIEAIERLNKLKDCGALTEHEFDVEKRKILQS